MDLQKCSGRICVNKRTVIIGGVVLIIGVALIVVGVVEVLGSTTIITTFNQPQNGEYVSTELILNSTSGVAVSSAAATAESYLPRI